MSSAAPSSEDVRDQVEALGPPGTPVTTPEVAAAFECTQRTIYNRLDDLADDGVLETKKVGANSRVWWQPADGGTRRSEAGGRERVRSHPVFDSGMVGVIVWDEDLRIADANEAFLEMAGLDYEEALGIPWRELTPEEFYGDSERHVEQVEETGSGVPYEKQYYHADGSRWWGLFESRRLSDGGYVEFVVDVTDRTEAQTALRESEAALERLNAATKELLDADTATIADRVAPLVRGVLDVEYATLWRYDDASGELKEYAADAAPDVESDELEFPTDVSDAVWEAFVGTDLDVANDLDVTDDPGGPEETSPALRSHTFVPLGRHGVVCLGSTQADTFDESTTDLVETVAATVETTWDRADSENELKRQNEELERLDRVNSLIRAVGQALVAADSREEIDDAVCQRLADSDRFEFAWIGDRDPDGDVVEPRAWAGVDSGYLEGLTVSVQDSPPARDPIARAVVTGELQVVADIATDTGFAPWREATLERGARSLVCIPLVYDDASYGVLTVYADSPQSDDRTLDVLSELGTTIAHAINARETRATLQTDSVVELTVRFEDPDEPLCRLATATDCTIDYHGFVSRTSGHVDVFFTARDTSPVDLRDAAADVLAVEDLQCLTERADGSLYRVRVADRTLAERCTDEGAVLRSLTIDAGVATAVLDVPHTAAVREFLDQLRAFYPGLELQARKSRERPLKTRQTFAAALADALTDRQRVVLQTAYLSGFFETPRASTGQEVTDLLGVSQPTFSEHLRAAERTLCSVLFEANSDDEVEMPTDAT